MAADSITRELRRAMDRMSRLQAREHLTSLAQSCRTMGWRTSSLLTGLLGLVLFASWRTSKLAGLLTSSHRKQENSEPGLITKHSSFESFTTAAGHTYPSIRVFYHPHPQAAKLPKDIPLLVFMHGLGGNVTQFAPLLTSLVNIAPCLAIDLPGCGLSEFKPHDPGAYTTTAYAELLCAVIDRFRDRNNNQQVVLIGHSMGCSISALLASSTSALQIKFHADYIIGLIAISPRSAPFTAREANSIERLKYMPTLVFDLFRLWDRRGGANSASITRMIGEGADIETKKLQQKFNSQSKSAVFLRTLAGMLPVSNTEDAVFPGKDVWSGIKVPLFLAAGEADKVTPPREVEQIARWLTKRPDGNIEKPLENVAATKVEQRSKKDEQEFAPDEDVPPSDLDAGATSTALPTTAGDVNLAQYQLASDYTIPAANKQKHVETDSDQLKDSQQRTQYSFALKTVVFPAPAAHGLLYATSTVRILSGLIETFLAHHVDERLALGCQLQHMTTSGKWDVKNFAKWQKIAQCSDPIAGVFRAMKTMREVDEVHNPREFVKKFGYEALPDGVAMIVDISHESPVYDPKGLEEGGVEYHKFPTVSKLPPTPDEVEHFISLIDELRRSPKLQIRDGEQSHPCIGLHCHYGFNRTGFFLVCYLVERLGYRMQDAIDEFAAKRAPGIKHEHFVNELYVRYAVKMERRGTVVG